MSTETLTSAEPRRPAVHDAGARAIRTSWERYKYPLILGLLAVAAWLPRLQGPIDLRYDAGVYYILGTSLAEGRGYRLLNEPGAIQGIQYPPLLPALVAVHQWFAGTSDPLVVGRWLRLFYGTLFVLLIPGAYVLARRFLTPVFAFFAALIVLLHADQLWLADLFHAELPYTFATVAFLAAWWLRPPMLRQVVAGGLAIAAFLLRTAGIALLVAWVGESLLRRRYRETALRAAVALLPILGWQYHVSQVRNDPAYDAPHYPYQRAAYQFNNVTYLENLLYVDPFQPELGRISVADLPARAVSNLPSMLPALGEAVSSRADWSRSELRRINERLPLSVPLELVYLPLLLLAVGVIAGLALLAVRGEWLVPLYVAGSVGLICLTPWPGQITRYLAPLIPVLAVGLLLSLQATRHRWREHPRVGRYARALAPVVLAGVFVMQIFPAYKTYEKRGTASWPAGADRQVTFPLFFYRADWQSHERAADWLAQAAAPDDVVVTSTPHWLYLRSGLRAIMPPYTPDAAEAQRLVDAVPARFLIVDSLEFLDVTRRYAAPLVEAYPERWSLVYATPDSASRVYQRLSGVGSTSSR